MWLQKTKSLNHQNESKKSSCCCRCDGHIGNMYGEKVFFRSLGEQGHFKTIVGRWPPLHSTPDEQVSFSLRKIGGKKCKGRSREGKRGIISSNFQFCSKGKKRREGSARNKAGIFDAGFGEILRSPSYSGQKNANFNLIHANLASQIPALARKQRGFGEGEF